MKIQSKITKENNEYYIFAFLDEKFKKTKLQVFLPDYAKKRIEDNSADKKWILTGILNNNIFKCSSIEALPYRYKPKKSVVNHKPIYEESPYNPVNTKSKNKIGYGINTSKRSIKNQIINAFKGEEK